MSFAPDCQQRQRRSRISTETPLWPLISRALAWSRRLLARAREFNAKQAELHERMRLLDQPWQEDLLHWSHDGHDWQLHGHLLPPANGRRRSVTRDGWCPRRG